MSHAEEIADAAVVEAALDARTEPAAFGLRNDAIRDALAEVMIELRAACNEHRRFASAHEGWAVILEELDELKEQVWLRREYRDKRRMHEEAVHVAAMALRFMLEVKG